MKTETIANRLYWLRVKHLDITQAELSKITGIDIRGVSYIETGRRCVSLKHLSGYLRAIPELNLHWLITGIGDWRVPVVNEEGSK